MFRLDKRSAYAHIYAGSDVTGIHVAKQLANLLNKRGIVTVYPKTGVRQAMP